MTCIYIIRYTASVVMAMANSFFGRSTPLKICRAMHLALSDLDLWTFALKFRLPVNFLTWLNCRRSLTVATFFAFDLTMTTDGRTPGCNAWCRLPAEQRITITSCDLHNFLFFIVFMFIYAYVCYVYLIKREYLPGIDIHVQLLPVTTPADRVSGAFTIVTNTCRLSPWTFPWTCRVGRTLASTCPVVP